MFFRMRIGLLFLAAVMIVSLVLALCFSNSSSLRQPLPTTFSFQYRGEYGGPPSIETIVKLASDQLLPQMAIGTIPQLTAPTVAWKIGLPRSWAPRWMSMDLTWRYDQFLITNKYSPMGGYALFSYNFDFLRTSEDFTRYVEMLKTRYELRLTFKNTFDNSEYLVIIDPLIAADCVPNNVPLHYCRYLPDAPFLKNSRPPKDWKEAAAQYAKVGERYRSYGLHTPFGPVVDLPTGGAIAAADMPDYAVVSAKNLMKEGIIPTLKHFAYNYAHGDAHFVTYTDNRSLDELEARDLKPYFAVNALGQPFLLMTTHHVLAAFDRTWPTTRSDAVLNYIHSRINNAVVVTDEISMGGFSKGDALDDRVRSERGDMFIVHSGILDVKSRHEAIYHGLYTRQRPQDEDSVKRILNLKQHYGLLRIYERR